MTHRTDSGLVAWLPTAVWPGQLGLCADTRLQTAQEWAALAREGAGLVALLLDEDAPDTTDLADHAGKAGLGVVSFALPWLGWPEDQESFVAYLDN
ncbi:hypothetical protein GCM10008955_13040 [Deinococcus malanensis]|uniref:Uncharacterized protein n=1 Tax=Deinococcus malanensis TaxID=1706855 RepID=A0ABQ2ET29_9DEIO|nr:hypothetical protein [Deinococcus malanensis]GGK21007.1 hypothetical protein GCM10008955_13040 [Deinococcus malanensis]